MYVRVTGEAIRTQAPKKEMRSDPKSYRSHNADMIISTASYVTILQKKKVDGG